MKKNIIAVAVASVFAAPLAMAQAPTIYGQINMAAEHFDNDSSDKKSGSQINSRNSRVGIKGSEDLGNGLKAIYKLEFTVTIDDDKGDGSFKSRNQYVGLAGGFGTVLVGRHDTPTKMIQAKDLFNDGKLADNKPMAGGLGVNGNGMETRLAEMLAYVSPEFAGVKLIAALSPSEDKNKTTSKSGMDDMYSLAVTYGSAKKGLYLAAGMDKANSEFAGVGKKADHVRVVAQYTVGGLVANAMYQDFSGNALKNTYKGGENIQANLGYKMGKFMPKVKVSQVERESGFKNSTNYALGLDYALGKKTTAYVEYAELENVYKDYSADKDGSDIRNDKDTSAFSVGILHKF